MARRETTDDLDALMEALPPEICERLRSFADRSDLLEVVMDLGRRPEARFTRGEEVLLDREVNEEGQAEISPVALPDKLELRSYDRCASSPSPA